jgi:uncharacterized protein (TIGR02145 family)
LPKFGRSRLWVYYCKSLQNNIGRNYIAMLTHKQTNTTSMKRTIISTALLLIIAMAFGQGVAIKENIAATNEIAKPDVTLEISTLQQLLPGTTYSVLLNSPEAITFTDRGWECGESLVDARDGQSYETVQIGSQCWMAKNLNIGTRIDGSANQADNGIIEKYCYDNSEAQCDIYGGLYQWNEMMAYLTTPGEQGICPAGWHIPTDAEWCILEQALDITISCGTTQFRGIDGGGKLKEAGTTHWLSPNTGATNSSGFTGLPGGSGVAGSFSMLTYFGYWWSSSQAGSNAWNRRLYYGNAQVSRNSTSKTWGFSVRCIKDESASAELPTVSTGAISGIISTAAISGGNVTDDGGADVTVRGVCWSTSQSPTIADNVIADGTGTGEFTSYINWLTPETTYFVRAYATNSVGTAYGEEFSFTTDEAGAVDCGLPFTDPRDDQTYQTVQIGSQCWMAENLAYLPAVSPPWQGNDPVPFYFVYDYQGTSVEEAKVTTNYQTYGVLYNWHAAMISCPTGWHLPSDDEWCILEQEIDPTIDCSSSGWRGLDGGGKLKKTGTAQWNAPNTGATNSSGFTALPGGLRNSLGSFDNLGDWGYWWSSSQIGSGTAWSRYLNNGSIQVGRWDNGKLAGFSVRCIKDTEIVGVPVDLPLDGVTVGSGQENCYNASQSITVQNFTVQSGGQATFIAGAGGSIVFLPETRVHHDGYLHAYITLDESYCTNPLSILSSDSKTAGTDFQGIATENSNDEPVYYPNPTRGLFTIDLSIFKVEEEVLIEIFSMHGEAVYLKQTKGSGLSEINLSGKQPGLYVIRLVSGKKVMTGKILKL